MTLVFVVKSCIGVSVEDCESLKISVVCGREFIIDSASAIRVRSDSSSRRDA